MLVLKIFIALLLANAYWPDPLVRVLFRRKAPFKINGAQVRFAPVRGAAMTLSSRTILLNERYWHICTPEMKSALTKHEGVHVNQARRYDIMYLPLYGLIYAALTVRYLSPKRAYREHPWERAADRAGDLALYGRHA